MCLKVIYECFSASAAGKENFVKKKKKKTMNCLWNLNYRFYRIIGS